MPCAPLSSMREACQCSRPATRTIGVMPTRERRRGDLRRGVEVHRVVLAVDEQPVEAAGLARSARCRRCAPGAGPGRWRACLREAGAGCGSGRCSCAVILHSRRINSPLGARGTASPCRAPVVGIPCAKPETQTRSPQSVTCGSPCAAQPSSSGSETLKARTIRRTPVRASSFVPGFTLFRLTGRTSRLNLSRRSPEYTHETGSPFPRCIAFSPRSSAGLLQGREGHANGAPMTTAAAAGRQRARGGRGRPRLPSRAAAMQTLPDFAAVVDAEQGRGGEHHRDQALRPSGRRCSTLWWRQRQVTTTRTIRFNQFFRRFQRAGRPMPQMPACRAWARASSSAPTATSSPTRTSSTDADEVTREAHRPARVQGARCSASTSTTDVAVIKIDAQGPADREARRPVEDPRRRMGARDRLAVRLREHRDRGHRQRQLALAARGQLRAVHPDRRGGESRQLGRAAVQPAAAR